MAKKASKIAGAFVAHSKEMRESAAWRLLPDNARRLLDRLELEHMRQGGAENGRLICTYSDFEEAGLRRQSISLAIRQTTALGFLEITRKGYKAAAEFRAPSLYRLTYVFNADARRYGEPTHQWRRFTDERDARTALRDALSAHRKARPSAN